jgi:hypothetical protein
MTYPRFLTLTTLSGVVALCILLQIVFVRLTQTDELRLQQTEAALQQGELCDTRLVQIAKRIAQVAQQQQDQQLKDLLTRQGFEMKPPAGSNAPALAPAPAPSVPATTH